MSYYKIFRACSPTAGTLHWTNPQIEFLKIRLGAYPLTLQNKILEKAIYLTTSVFPHKFSLGYWILTSLCHKCLFFLFTLFYLLFMIQLNQFKINEIFIKLTITFLKKFCNNKEQKCNTCHKSEIYKCIYKPLI